MREGPISGNEGALLGRQLVATLERCDVAALDDVPRLERGLTSAAEAVGARVVAIQSHRFEPQGTTVAAILSESHAVLHSWPEHAAATVDLFTCNADAVIERALEPLLAALGGRVADLRVVERPAPSGVAVARSQGAA